MYYWFFGLPQFQNHYPKYQNLRCNPLLFPVQSNDLDRYYFPHHHYHHHYFFIIDDKILTLIPPSISIVLVFSLIPRVKFVLISQLSSKKLFSERFDTTTSKNIISSRTRLNY
jgi:hypothetical protein